MYILFLSNTRYLFCDYREWRPTWVIIPSVYFLVFVLGSLGNVRLPDSSRSLTDSLIASLAAADLAFVVTLPLWAAHTALDYHWPFGKPLCQVSSYLVALNMYASVFSLAVLSMERYWVIAGRQRSSRAAWVVSAEQLREEDDREQAELLWTAALGLKSTLVGFLLPLIVLLICYCSLGRLLSRHFGQGPRPDRRRQRRLLRVIVTLVLAFFLCWLPFHANKTLSMLMDLELLPYSCPFDRTLVAAHPYATCLGYVNSCLNPLLYACCDVAFRKRCRALLQWLEQASRSSAIPSGTRKETGEGIEGKDDVRHGRG
uniref:Apelin receptor 2 n=1 Tax=Hucho hucho TaxID=62062 RepID=A0A4W5NQF4_9TELE